jgi:hypothetical protein
MTPELEAAREEAEGFTARTAYAEAAAAWLAVAAGAEEEYGPDDPRALAAWVRRHRSPLDLDPPSWLALRKVLTAADRLGAELGPSSEEALYARLTAAWIMHEGEDPAGSAGSLAGKDTAAAEALGAGHPLTLSIRRHLARSKAADAFARPEGKAALISAEAELREITEAFRETLGPAHLETLETVADLGWAVWRAGDTASGRQLLAQAESGMAATLGPDHPITLVVTGNLAYAYRELGDRPGEARTFARLAEGRERALGRTHYKTLQARDLLARARAGRAEAGR